MFKALYRCDRLGGHNAKGNRQTIRCCSGQKSLSSQPMRIPKAIQFNVSDPLIHHHTRALTGNAKNHHGDLSRNLLHTGDFNFASIPLSIPVREKVRDNSNCLLPYETMIRLAKATRNNLAMATPLFTFSRQNIGAKDREYFVDSERLGKCTMLGGDLLLPRRCAQDVAVRRVSSLRTLMTYGSAVFKATPTHGQKPTTENTSTSNSLKAATLDRLSLVSTISLANQKAHNHI